jgi:hypothetical protein
MEPTPPRFKLIVGLFLIGANLRNNRRHPHQRPWAADPAGPHLARRDSLKLTNLQKIKERNVRRRSNLLALKTIILSS